MAAPGMTTTASGDFRRGPAAPPLSPRSPMAVTTPMTTMMAATTTSRTGPVHHPTLSIKLPTQAAGNTDSGGRGCGQRSMSPVVPSTIKLLTELERSWSMFSASWKVADLFGGMQIWQEQASEAPASEPLNGMFLSTTSAGLIAFLAASIGGGGIIVAVFLSAAVVFGTMWTMTSSRLRGDIPCFKVMRPIDGSPSEIFLYLMNIKNFPSWDSSIEKANVIHTIDDHSDIIHIAYRPVWVWPVWVLPRDLCLLRYWRRTEDGAYVICLQSTVHPECPPTHGIIRAKCNGGGFIISPRGQSATTTDELTSMVTHVVHMDPLGWESKLLQRFNCMYLYLRPFVLALSGLQEVMEARKYVCPNISEEFSSVTSIAQGLVASQQARSDDPAGSTSSGASSVSALREFPCNVPRAMWAEPDGGSMLVRGPDYLTDRRKIPSARPALRLVGVDLFQSNAAVEHIAARSDNIVQKEIKRHEAEGTEMPFTFVINFVVPGTPRLNLVLYYQAPHHGVLNDSSPFAELMNDFLDGTDEYRNERFKLIPCIVEGSFIVRQAVGSTPAIIGKKLRQPCFRNKNYFELDVDIASSAVANRVVGLVTGYTKKLVIDMGFLIEGQRSEELPERLFGSCRLVHIDLSVAKKLEL